MTQKPMLRGEVGARASLAINRRSTVEHYENTWGAVFCMSKIPQKDAKVMSIFLEKLTLDFTPKKCVASKVTYHAWKRGKVVNSVMVVP